MKRKLTVQASFLALSVSVLSPVLMLAALNSPGLMSVGIFSLVTSLNKKAVADEIVFSHDVNSQNVDLLEAARNIDPNPSRGGGDIGLVDESALEAQEGPQIHEGSDTAAPKASDQISIYIVREGDSLSQIADMFGVSVNTVLWSNNLKSKTDIHEGQTLVILPVSGVRHTVAKGDTLASIAAKYKGDEEEILTFNGLSDESKLAVGMMVTIPGGEIVAPKPQKKSSGAATPLKGAGGPAIAGFYIHPVPSASKTQGLHGYNGIDLGASVGTSVRASAGGTVIVSRVGGWNGGYGNYIVISHPNGTQTLYAHLSDNIVWQGQEVVQGQVIGYVGNTGRSTGPHLHFEVRGARNPF